MISNKNQPAYWRLVKTPPMNGAWNMAMDEVILERIGAGKSRPTLRLFAWSPPCVSLGFGQPLRDIDQKRLAERGWDIVRRITGGRAILHTDELTYSVIGPYEEPRLAGGVLESYFRLSNALTNSVKSMGIEALANQKNSKKALEFSNQDPVCFEVPSNYEITVNGKKLIGSAQARNKHGILQHGTLPLNGDLTRIFEVLTNQVETGGLENEDSRKKLLDRATTAETILGRIVPWEEAAGCFIDEFEKTLNIKLEESEPTKAEIDQVNSLIKDKYANPKWTESR